ncbi:MAG: YaiI/YqxD family protein [Proteobacteria bacterium]|nr:MAG: YaiI/YqxD family protein [Pseudomonadota bacterium]
MKIWIDADACPTPVKDVVYRASEKRQVHVCLVANQVQRVPRSPFITQIQVAKTPDAADHLIILEAETTDMVITADVPMAAELVAKGVHVINPRGETYTEANMQERLNMRDMMDKLRGAGLVTGGPATYNDKDKQAFANALDRWLQKALGQRA